MKSERALIIVDVQQDFCEGGSLPVAGGADVAKKISDYVITSVSQYPLIIGTQDWHPIKLEDHFSPEPDYVTTWPKHCVRGTMGADFHPNLSGRVLIDHIFRKGQQSPAYSGFEGTMFPYDSLTLHEFLETKYVHEVDIVGIAYDHCVKATALDSVRLGYRTCVLKHLTAAVNPETAKAAEEEMRKAGVVIS